ncbi:MAG: YggS family pyridoxal phosphate-dependent enzyme [Candidatus Thermochlorobacter sp.]
MSVLENLRQIRQKIQRACEQSGRAPESVRLVAVSKNQSAAQILQAYEAGQRVFGENYVQELLDKQSHPLLCALDIEWHFIGHLQSNKVKHVVDKVAMIQTLDSLHLAEVLSRRAAQSAQRVPILLEINISGEKSKHGFKPEEVYSAARKIFELPYLELRGLMTIGSADNEKARDEFKMMKALFEDLKRLSPCPETFSELSMGMSGDFEEAIAAGATMVRVGTAIFGERSPLMRP